MKPSYFYTKSEGKNLHVKHLEHKDRHAVFLQLAYHAGTIEDHISTIPY